MCFINFKYKSTNVFNYIDNTPCLAGDLDIGNLKDKFEHNSVLLIEQFERNFTKANLDRDMKRCLQILDRVGFGKMKNKDY